ncbi:MAG: energy transducer TonB family protein [Burkholderiales bacterium]
MAVALGGGMRAREAENRAFSAAILVSVAIHAALFFAWPGKETRKSSVVLGPLTARLVAPSPAAAPSPPAPQVEEAPRPKAEAPTPAPAAPVAKPAPTPASPPATKLSPAAKAAPPAKPAPSSTPGAEPAKPAAESAPAAPAAIPGPVAKVDPQPAAPAASAEDASNLAKYRLELIEAAKRYKTNPRVEGMREIQKARAHVVMVVGANGMIASITIKQSAGHAVLDRNALETLRKAKPLVQIPPALRGKEFSIEIPFIYELKDEGA